jgi:hypothetical protein
MKEDAFQFVPGNMKILRPHCRDKFTLKDFDFISSVLVSRRNKKKFLESLFTDPEIRDKILDAKPLFRAILEWNTALLISTYLYFYVVVRNIFLKKGIVDRVLADYVAMLLAESHGLNRHREQFTPKKNPFPYMIDLLGTLQEAHPEQRPALHADIGNHSLFITGIFREYILAREKRKGAPGLSYYEEMGRNNFEIASKSSMAEELELDEVYDDLSSLFQDIRVALNTMTRDYQYLHEAEEWKKVERLLKDVEAID